MRNSRQLRDCLRRLESVGYRLRSEAMLRNSPAADRAVKEWDELIEEGRKLDLAEAEKRERQKALRNACRCFPRTEEPKLNDQGVMVCTMCNRPCNAEIDRENLKNCPFLVIPADTPV